MSYISNTVFYSYRLSATLYCVFNKTNPNFTGGGGGHINANKKTRQHYLCDPGIVRDVINTALLSLVKMQPVTRSLTRSMRAMHAG
ncbi:hypothetical protein JYU34_010060 [Plutella xylostella]|uniref:Uncharacterized protein n=1 Tax=Plutella xylostella TaxID=51655 RepID=A0ABQ7QHL8_PLUXY|nr:hypothetical protein JYU34_010060 [Plutella xylostella]